MGAAVQRDWVGLLREVRAAVSLRIADPALPVAVGPSTVRLDSTAAASARSNVTGAGAACAARLIPPVRPGKERIGTPPDVSRSTSRDTVRVEPRAPLPKLPR